MLDLPSPLVSSFQNNVFVLLYPPMQTIEVFSLFGFFFFLQYYEFIGLNISDGFQSIAIFILIDA